jgi:hypothetical protein
MVNLKTFDQAIRDFRKPLGHPDLDEITVMLAEAVQIFRDSHREVITELLTMYESASEHNVDISRKAIYDLAQRMIGPLPSEDG